MPAAGLDLQTLRQLRLPAPPLRLAGRRRRARSSSPPIWASIGGPPPALPRDTAALLDFAALAVRGRNAGSPARRAAACCTRPTAAAPGALSPLPPRCPWTLYVFPTTGTAGPSGRWERSLPATTAGGVCRQRAGGARAALLGLFCHEDDVPLELLARLAGNEGYLSVVDVLGRRDLEVPPTTRPTRDDRIRPRPWLPSAAAVRKPPGNSPCDRPACNFPPRKSSNVGIASTAAADCKTWKPTSCGRFRLCGPEIVATQLAAAARRRAAQQVGRPDRGRRPSARRPIRAFPVQTTLAGLDPWQVKRAYGSLSPGNRGRST